MESHWKSFRKLRNKVTTLIRDSKKSFYDKLADKLKSSTTTTKDWWSTLKILLIQTQVLRFLPLNMIMIFIQMKATRQTNNKYFQSQTM